MAVATAGCVDTSPSESGDDAMVAAGEGGSGTDPDTIEDADGGDVSSSEADAEVSMDAAPDADEGTFMDAGLDGSDAAGAGGDADVVPLPVEGGVSGPDASANDAALLPICTATGQITPSAEIVLPRQSPGHIHWKPVPLFTGKDFLVIWREVDVAPAPWQSHGIRVSRDGELLGASFPIDTPGVDYFDAFEHGFDGTNFLGSSSVSIGELAWRTSVLRVSTTGTIVDSLTLPCPDASCSDPSGMCSADNCLVLWGSSDSLYAARYRDGALLDAPILVARGTTSQLVATFDGTHYLLTWDNGVDAIERAKIHATSGAFTQQPSLVAPLSYPGPRIASNGAASLLVWSGPRAGFAAAADQLHAMRVRSDGSQLLDTVPFLLAPMLWNQGMDPQLWHGPQREPTLSFDGQEWISGWIQGGGENTLLATRIFGDGMTDPPTRIAESADTPMLASDGQGRSLITYLDDDTAKARLLVNSSIRCRPCGQSDSDGLCSGACLPGTLRCAPNGLQACGADAVWGTVQACAADQVCVTASGTAACKQRCTTGATRCSGRIRQRCGPSGTWGDGESCTGAALYCAEAGCSSVPKSCQATSLSCGPNGESCCASSAVPGGSFSRFFRDDGSGPVDLSDPTTVSSFSLDKFHATVGRFRQFVQAWNEGFSPLPGAGKHAHLRSGRGLLDMRSPELYEPGWLMGDDVYIAPTSANLNCGNAATWTATPADNEDRPINCITWYEAFAFCIWDGGFLPSDSELLYAAVGGDQHRVYPWGTTEPGLNSAYAIYDCLYPGIPPSTAGFSDRVCDRGAQNIAPVGTTTLGAGRWGQYDLNGNAQQWTFDWSPSDPLQCSDCTKLLAGGARMIRGTPFFDDDQYRVTVVPIQTPRFGQGPTIRSQLTGFRCARAPM